MPKVFVEKPPRTSPSYKITPLRTLNQIQPRCRASQQKRLFVATPQLKPSQTLLFAREVMLRAALSDFVGENRWKLQDLWWVVDILGVHKEKTQKRWKSTSVIKRCFCITCLCKKNCLNLFRYKLVQIYPNQNLCCGIPFSKRKSIGGLHHVWKLLEFIVGHWVRYYKINLSCSDWTWISSVAPKLWFKMIEPVVFDPSIEEIIWVTEKHKFRAFRYGLLFTQIDGGVLMFRVAHKKKSNRVAGWKNIPW